MNILKQNHEIDCCEIFYSEINSCFIRLTVIL